MRRHALRKRYGHLSKGSQKARLMGRIRRMSTTAAEYRLGGKIHMAMHFDETIDRLVQSAERQGWADEAVGAEERGRLKAEKEHVRSRYRK